MKRIAWLSIVTAFAILVAAVGAFAQGGEGQQSVTAAAVLGGLGASPIPFRQSPATGPPPYGPTSAPPAPGAAPPVGPQVAGVTPGTVAGLTPSQLAALPPNPTALVTSGNNIYVIANGYLMKFDRNLCMLSQIPLPAAPSVAVAGFRSQPAASQTWTAHLAPLEAQGYSYASGLAQLWLDPDGRTLHYLVTVQNIRNVTGVYLQYAMGQIPALQAPVVASLYRGPLLTRSFTGTLAQGAVTSADLTGWFASYPVANLAQAISAGRVYVVVHTTQHPQAEIMGLLRPETG